MGRHAAGVFESLVGDAAPVRGRTVVGLGIALGLAVGLGTWVLSDPPARRQPLSMAQPANVPPPDVMAPQLVPPTDGATDGLGAAPSTPDEDEQADEDHEQPDDQEPVGKPPATPPPARLPEAILPLTARYVTRHVWNVGFVADIHVTNPADTAQSFEVRLDLPHGVRLTNQIWNATADASTGLVTFRGGPVPAGQTLTFGFVADKGTYYSWSTTPTSCTVNSNPCVGFTGRDGQDRERDYDGYSRWRQLDGYGWSRYGTWRYG